MEHDDTCGLCDETVEMCTCWRCMECETMHAETEDPTEDDDGELICAECAGGNDTKIRAGSRIRFDVWNGEYNEKWTGTVVDDDTRFELISEDAEHTGNQIAYYDDWLVLHLDAGGHHAIHIGDKYEVLK